MKFPPWWGSGYFLELQIVKIKALFQAYKCLEYTFNEDVNARNNKHLL